MTPHSPTGALLCALCALTLLSRGIPVGLTSKPHHAHRRFGRLTWTALPATGIGLQPQTRRYQPAPLYAEDVENARIFSVFDKKTIRIHQILENPWYSLTQSFYPKVQGDRKALVLSRAVRESHDCGSAVRVRFKRRSAKSSYFFCP